MGNGVFDVTISLIHETTHVAVEVSGSRNGVSVLTAIHIKMFPATFMLILIGFVEFAWEVLRQSLSDNFGTSREFVRSTTLPATPRITRLSG